MTLVDRARYHWNVDLLGRAFLRYERLRGERKARRPKHPPHEHFSPMLRITPRLKEFVSQHYLAGRHVAGLRKVAWVTSGAPVEILKSLGYFVLYPEKHGALCGVRRVAEDLCTEAENEGFSRDICSYARTDIGAPLSGKTPVGKLPRPDLVFCCTNICQTVLHWYRVLAEHFQVPLILIDTPFLYGADEPAHVVDYVKRQIEEAGEIAGRVAGKPFSMRALEQVLQRSADATQLWLQVMETGRARPAPISAFEEFFHMGPIVEMRGDDATVDYYRALLAELQQRVKDGVGALKNERKRLLWDNLPIWFWVRDLSSLLAERGVAVVASTYTNAWGELAGLIDPSRPFDSMARVYLHPILNRGTGDKLATIARMVGEYEADGVILHSDRSCKPYSIGQMDQRDRLVREHGVPALLLEADHNDPRVFSEEQARTRVAAFLEVLGV